MIFTLVAWVTVGQSLFGSDCPARLGQLDERSTVTWQRSLSAAAPPAALKGEGMDSIEGDPGDGRPSLADVTRLPLSSLLTSGDAVIDHALRRVLRELDERPDISSAFGNTLG
jgi:FXSXX-COOH protein